MSRVLRIGSRGSDLALWQANTVKQKLSEQGVAAEIIIIKSEGDLKTDVPIYELGIVGVFTRSLDIALLNKDVDLAVHSMKDVPTQLPKGIVKTAVLERANPADVLVHKGLDFLNTEGILATGSLRRKAQWLSKYPNHEVVDLRGNINTRLIKLIENKWHGAIFAQAGLERIKLLPKEAIELDWMVPAPAQGAMLVVALENNKVVVEATAKLNHIESDITTHIEREFLRTLEGGCTAPIGALAKIEGSKVHFKGSLHALNGSTEVIIEKERDLQKFEGFGKSCAYEVLENGGKQLMEEIKNELNNTIH